jgi:Signal transduction histidine kinase
VPAPPLALDGVRRDAAFLADDFRAGAFRADDFFATDFLVAPDRRAGDLRADDFREGDFREGDFFLAGALRAVFFRAGALREADFLLADDFFAALLRRAGAFLRAAFLAVFRRPFLAAIGCLPLEDHLPRDRPLRAPDRARTVLPAGFHNSRTTVTGIRNTFQVMRSTSLRLRWPLLVLMASIGLTAFAAFDTQRTVRDQTKLVNKALHEFATFTAWSYAEHLQTQLSSTAIEVVGAVNHGRNMHTNPRVPAAHDLIFYLPYDASCDCHRTTVGPNPATFFAFKLGTKQVDAARNSYARPEEGWRIGPMPDRMMADMDMDMMSGSSPYTDAERKWIGDTLTALARSHAQQDGYGFVVGRQNGRTRPLIYTLMPTSWGDTLVYGVEYTPTALAKTLALVLDSKGLLPASFTEGRRNRDVVALRIVDGSGKVVFNSAPGITSDVTSELQLPPPYGALTVEVSVRPEQAANLIIGGTPKSRLPFLLGLLALAAMLSVIAVMQIRRETELAGLRADFVSSISHELRTPLAQIKLYLETLQTGRAATPEKREWSLGHIDRETTRLGNLVENVLRFSRLGRPDSSPASPIEFETEVSRIIDEFRPLAASRKALIELRSTNANPGEHLGVMVRPEGLRHIVVNLLDNAVKYGPIGQTIHVSVGPSSESKKGKRELMAVLSITDEGGGVPERDRDRIWSAFARAKTSTGAAGSGIGLTIVHDVVIQNGGTVRVESGEGSGARFVVSIPAVRIAVQPQVEELENAMASH